MNRSDIDVFLEDILGSAASLPPVDAQIEDAAAGVAVVPAVAQTSYDPAVVPRSAQNGNVAYEASDVTEKLAAWRPPMRSADGDILPEKSVLDARGRDTLRNDAYVAGAATIHKDAIVGNQYLLNARPNSRIIFGRDDPTWENEFQEEVETKFTLWAESPRCWPDASRHNTLTEMVRLAVGVYTGTGEVLATAEWMRRDGRPYRTAVQFVDVDRLSTPYHLTLDRRIRKGVERDFFGAPVRYYIRKTHPNDVYDGRRIEDMNKWTPVKAETRWGRQMVLHIFEQQRPDQTRGIAAMTTALTEMRMMKRFRQTELERAVIAATYAASIETDLPPGEVYTIMGSNDGENPTADWANGYLASVAEYSGGAKNMNISGARIPVFYPGTHLKIQNPGAESPSGSDFEKSLLRHVAAALDLSYEELSRDFSNTNYSSARAAMASTGRAMKARKKIVADRTANFIYRLWLEEAINYDHLETLRGRNVPSFYEGLNAEAYSAAEWIGAGTGYIDPLKEVQADMLDVKSGFTTKEAVIAKRHGADYRRVAAQRRRELTLDRELGLTSIHENENQSVENALGAEPGEGNDDA